MCDLYDFITPTNEWDLAKLMIEVCAEDVEVIRKIPISITKNRDFTRSKADTSWQ